ncbi:tRNA (adenosine(37)-N6)-threonylcarbamoyltransferase complex dimerization subunit type 1 TsaB [Myxococcota bacterium]
MTKDPLHERLLAIATEVRGPLLAFDTSGPSAAVCTVAWQRQEVCELELPAASMPSESLAAALHASIVGARLDVRALRGIVIGLGPGSFTGLRVGLATAKGLALGAGVELYGVSSLAMLAASCGPGLVAPVLDARAGEVFGALYNVESTRVISLMPDAAYVPEVLVARIVETGCDSVKFVGAGVTTCRNGGLLPSCSVEEAPRLRAGHGILLAADRIRRHDPDPLDALAPRYMRLSEAERSQ